MPSLPGIGDVQDDAIYNQLDTTLRSSNPRSALRDAERLVDDQFQVARAQYRR
jgi:hypothetical protein